jgi:hypothetical protein
MNHTFSDLVDEVRELPVSDMAELRSVIDHELIEARREEIYLNHLEGISLWEQGKLTPSSDIDEIMRRLEEE